MTEPNEPSNPTIWDGRHNPEFERDNDGLTKREYFVGQALAGITADRSYCPENYPESVADLAVRIADQVIKRLNKDE